VIEIEEEGLALVLAADHQGIEEDGVVALGTEVAVEMEEVNQVQI
jgi:hypothetical protein